MVKQFDIYWTDLSPALGSEYNKIRPCIVVSPDELNQVLNTAVIVPLTSTIRHWPFRCRVELDGKQGEACIDQIRVIDKIRLKDKAGTLTKTEAHRMKALIREMFVD